MTTSSGLSNQLGKAEVASLFQDAITAGHVQRFKKVGRVICRPVVPGETIITIVAGKVETLKKATDDSYIIKNIEPGAAAEQYIISGDSFRKRYELKGEVHAIDGQRWEVALPTGECEGFVYEGETITFMAPWGEKMLCENGDQIVRRPDKHDDIYRIEKGEFARTYEFISNL